MRGGSKIDFERQTVRPQRALLERPSKIKRPNLQGGAARGNDSFVIAEPIAIFSPSLLHPLKWRRVSGCHRPAAAACLTWATRRSPAPLRSWGPPLQPSRQSVPPPCHGSDLLTKVVSA